MRPATFSFPSPTLSLILGLSLSLCAFGAADDKAISTSHSGAFTRLAPEATGVDVVNTMDSNPPLSYLYHSGMTCGGVAIQDLNGDGSPDLVFGGGRTASRIYLNKGEKGQIQFADATEGSGFKAGGAADDWVAGIAVGDANGDGKPDLYTCRYMQPNQLWLNTTGADKKLKFTLAAESNGLGLVDCSHSAAFADYDGDGDLDLYVLTNRIEDPKGSRADIKELVNYSADGAPTIKPEMEKYYSLWRYDYENWGTEATGTPDKLYRNDSKGGEVKFTDVTEAAGISGRGDGLSLTWWDYDRDGKPDIYIGNDFITADRLYHNNGDGTFTDVLPSAAPHSPWFSMGCDQGDVNNDLLPDLLIADMSATSHYKSKTTMGIMGGLELKRAYFASPQQQMQNTLLIGVGSGKFSEGARLFGVSSTDWTWAVKFADLDNDGWQDVYFTNGISRHMNDSDIKVTRDMLIGKHMFEYWKEGEMRKEKNRAYRNTGHAKFEEVSDAWGLGHMGVSYGAAYSDLDRDGDLDFVVVNLEEPNAIWRNDMKVGNWLEIELAGPEGNSYGIGSEVVVKTEQGQQLRYLSPQTGYLSYNEPVLHFGLGQAESASEVVVHWPKAGNLPAARQVLKNVKANQWLKISRKDGEPAAAEPAPAKPLFAESDALASVKIKDTGWEEDFKRTTLLPHSYSQLGPCSAWGDVNGDGHEDVFIGGSAGELAHLRLGTGKGKFTSKWIEAFRADKDCEDSAAVFFDADGDNDLDLCVVSGTNEFAAEAKEQRPRLYVNDGKGAFTAAKGLPELRFFAGCVAAADYDGDGKTDLFIGARCKAQDWPHSAKSYLLRNTSKSKSLNFTDVTDSVAGLGNAGLVSGAQWSDLDGNGSPDLALSCEWGPIKVFLNDKGKLQEKTESLGLQSAIGWWTNVAVADLNGDKRPDLVATNIGLNTKYKAPSAKAPMMMYYGVFDETGRSHVVEVKREKNEAGEILYPERGRSCSSTAMPFIKDKFSTFKSFALASLRDVYSEDKLAKAEKFEANEFCSGVWLNVDGKSFQWMPFVREAQNAPAFSAAVGDVTGDGKPDLFLAQNWLFGPQIETSRYDNGVGMLLKNDGKGQFTPVVPSQSGILISGDMKSAAFRDLNGDQALDLVVTRNSASTVVLLNQGVARP